MRLPNAPANQPTTPATPASTGVSPPSTWREPSRWREPSYGRDIVRYGGAIGAAVALGVVQVFVLPRRLDVVAYGQYRFFLVYVGYVGVLHLGLADGAFVRWASGPRGMVRLEWRRILIWLVGLQAVVVACALAAGALAGPIARRQLVSLAFYALFANTATLMAYALQASGDFRMAGVVAVLPAASFLAIILATAPSTLTAVLAAQVASVAVTAVVGVTAVARLRAVSRPHRDPVTITALVHVGAPVLGANLASSVSQFADRILVSSFAPAASLALYGFASSVMVAASAATQALSRVTLAHAARRSGTERARVLDGVCDVIVAGSGVALTALPAFEHVVELVLPAYVPALKIVRALALGAPWWIALHVVLLGTLQSYGMVRRQLALELSATALVLLACGGCLVFGAPLWAVAAASSASALIAWALGSLFVARCVADAAALHGARFAIRIGWIGGAVLLAGAMSTNWLVRTGVYAAIAAPPTLAAARAVRASWRR